MPMHIHILGISGTFMSALALLARSQGHTVTGSDSHCYPPVSYLLRDNGIEWTEGYEDSTQALRADQVIVGNAIKRGMPVMEDVINARRPYTSGPAWLYDHILTNYRVIAIAGTHGKTTTTSMIAWILHQAGLQPGFLIGGVASAFQTNACLGQGEWFVIEADEYDTAFFDKRPKFMHYRPEVAILNNLEFDHADIYADLQAIQQQFHYFLRTVPGNGLLIKPRHDIALNQVLTMGQYSASQEFGLQDAVEWSAELLHPSGSHFLVKHLGLEVAQVHWQLIGPFNVENALAAIAACYRAGVAPQQAASALSCFTPVKRRLEVKYAEQGITVYDDFAHHPTAIAKTIAALQQSQRHRRVLVVLEFASYSMKTGSHIAELSQALLAVDYAFLLNPSHFELQPISKTWTFPFAIFADTDKIVRAVTQDLQAGDAILVMSNRGFDNIHAKLIQRIPTITVRSHAT